MRRTIQVALALVVGAATVLAFGTPAYAGTYVTRTKGVTYGPYHLVFNNSGKCLDDTGYSLYNMTQMQQWACLSNSPGTYTPSNQAWYLQVSGTDGQQFRIRNAVSGKCLNVKDGSYTNGEQIIQYTCNSDRQEWFRQYTSPVSGYSFIEPIDNGLMALNVTGLSTSNGAKIQLWQEYNSTNEYIGIVGAGCVWVPNGTAQDNKYSDWVDYISTPTGYGQVQFHWTTYPEYWNTCTGTTQSDTRASYMREEYRDAECSYCVTEVTEWEATQPYATTQYFPHFNGAYWGYDWYSNDALSVSTVYDHEVG